MSGFASKALESLGPENALFAATRRAIDGVAWRSALELQTERWRPGKALKLLLAGYAGTRNTGSDVRTEEITRQLRHVVGDDALELAITSVDRRLTGGYFRGVRQVHLPAVFPKFLFDECPKHHGVVAVEGSMFKSKFTDALSTMMAGGLGAASAEGKLAVGYGAEAGKMSPRLRKAVAEHCKHALVMCRNEPSCEILNALGVRTLPRADTAWTFRPAPLERGASLLREAGWDGVQRILALCPVNPFWWPVRPDLLKAAAMHLLGEFRADHYREIYFHPSSEEISASFERYVRSVAEGATAFMAERDVFPVLIGMERLDRHACERMAPLFPRPPALFASDEYDMFDMVSVLQNASLVVSSRFHALVLSMLRLIPSAGVSMDERIENLMATRGHADLYMEVDDSDLADQILTALRRMDRDADRISDEIGRVIPCQVQLMGQMGIDFMDELCRIYPEFPRRDLPRTWSSHLPALAPSLESLLERY